MRELTEVPENGKVTGSYTYYAGGQLASATQGGKTESFGQGSPSESSTVVSTEGGGGALGNLTIVALSDANGNLSGGGSLGVSLTPVNENVAISQQWNETLFNTNDIADAINSVYDPNDGWLSGFFYDLFYRSGNDPVVTLE